MKSLRGARELHDRQMPSAGMKRDFEVATFVASVFSCNTADLTRRFHSLGRWMVGVVCSRGMGSAFLLSFACVLQT